MVLNRHQAQTDWARQRFGENLKIFSNSFANENFLKLAYFYQL